MDPRVAGKDLLHLQCHFGLDTLAWARRGARVTGVDFSEQGIGQARRLTAETGLDATFVVSDVAALVEGSYADPDASVSEQVEYAWQHSMGEIITTLATAGLRIEYLHEHPWVPWKMFPFMVEIEPRSGVWRLPEPDDARLPVLYSLKATKG